jgi:hypothetical protein
MEKDVPGQGRAASVATVFRKPTVMPQAERSRRKHLKQHHGGNASAFLRCGRSLNLHGYLLEVRLMMIFDLK